MDHLAILSKEGNFLEEIIAGRKIIESRWSQRRIAPFNQIKEGDPIYFKETAEPVTARAKASKIIFYENLNPDRIKEIINQYGKQIGIDQEYGKTKSKCKYCTLIFLEKIEELEPFNINKTGYALPSAWLTLESIEDLKK